MSEPMSSGEIEDVLSSIRKLVSEDLRPGPSRAKPEKSTTPAKTLPPFGSMEADKLLLTPAFRVVQDKPAQPGDEQPAPSGEAGEPVGELAADLPVAPSDVAVAPLTLDDSLRSDRSEPEGDMAEMPEAGAEDALDPHPAPEARIGAALSSIGSAVDQNLDEWESETGDGGFASLAWKAPQWVEEAEILAPAAAPVFDAPMDDLSPEDAEAAEAAARAEIEAADQTEAEQVADAPVGADPSTPRQSSTAARDGDEEDATDLFAEDEPYYDEALLRDLVRDIIREELSGTLGERITRNVRKLVRAEIARAMTMREFE